MATRGWASAKFAFAASGVRGWVVSHTHSRTEAAMAQERPTAEGSHTKNGAGLGTTIVIDASETKRNAAMAVRAGCAL